MSLAKSCSFAKNMLPLTQLAPRPVITWDMHERIKRNKECWDNPDSIVHRLPKHFQQRYWKDFVLAKRTPIHYDPPTNRFFWDEKRLVQLETEDYPIWPEYVPDQDRGLWGGEGVVKGYKESKAKLKKKILPRQWVPHFWFPRLKVTTLYSEILDKYLKLTVTERVHRLIDSHFGLDMYLLETRDVDINSRLGMQLKRLMLMTLARQDYHPANPERHDYVKAKYGRFAIPLEEADWYGLDLNTAARKQQDLEDNAAPIPLKYVLEKQFKQELEAKGWKKEEPLPAEMEEQQPPKGSEEDWGEWDTDWKRREEIYRKSKWMGWRG